MTSSTFYATAAAVAEAGVRARPALHMGESGFGMPTAAPERALRAHAPELFGQDPGRTYAEVVIYPRCRGDIGHHGRSRCRIPATAEAWYDVHHVVRALLPDDPMNTHAWEWRPIARAAQLPAPPRLGIEQREAGLAPLDPATADPAEVRFLGGEAEWLQMQRAHRTQALSEDVSQHAYDWAAAAVVYADILARIDARKLTPAERAAHAEYRVWQARQDLADAERSRDVLAERAAEAH